MKRKYKAISDCNFTSANNEGISVAKGSEIFLEDWIGSKMDTNFVDGTKPTTIFADFAVVAGVGTVVKTSNKENLLGRVKVKVDLVVTDVMPTGTTIKLYLEKQDGTALSNKTLTLGAITDATSSSTFQFDQPLNCEKVYAVVTLNKDAIAPYSVEINMYTVADTDLDKYLQYQSKKGYIPVKVDDASIL